MNSIKNTIVTVTLLAVGYGTYVVLSEPVPSEIAQGPNGVPWATTEDGASEDWESPVVDIPESTDAGMSTIPPDSELREISEGQPQLDTATSPSFTHAPDPWSVPSDQRTAPPEAPLPTDEAASPETPPWTGEPPVPADDPPANLMTGPSNDVATPVPDEGFYARGSDPSAGSAYPQTPAVDFPEATAAPAVTEESAPPGAPPVAGHSGFEETWKSVQMNLQNGQLAEALFALTVWYDEPSLSPDQTQRCIQLLDQLSGTVIYSRESFLEQAHVVQEGETLISLAQQYNVPQEFLARINGIYPMNELAPGNR